MARVRREYSEIILRGSLARAALLIALPVIGSSFLQMMYNLTDTYWLGKLGTEALAAINLVSPVQSMVIHFGGGLTTAGSVLIAQSVGAGEPRKASSMASQIFTCAMLFALVSAGLMSLLAGGIVSWLGAEGATLENGAVYLRIVALDMPFLFIVNIYQAVHQAQGNTVRPMLLNLLGISLNMALDPLLMLGFRLGAAGAALATVIAKAVPAAAALAMLLRPDERVHIRRDSLKPERDNLRLIVRIGLPTALGGSAMQFGFLLMSRTVHAYGVAAMAAYGIGNKINTLISLPSNAIGSAVATITGQNFGAGQIDRAQRGCRLSMGMAVGFLLIGGLILGQKAVCTPIVRLFSDSPEVVSMAADFLSLMAFWCWTNGIYNCLTGLFQGAGHTEITMASDASRLWVYRFTTLFVCRRLLHVGVESVWYSVVVSNGLAALALLILYKTGVWRKNRVRKAEKRA